MITFVNVTPIVLAEKQQRLLVAELNHRVRNMLQVVIGLCNQTLRRSTDLKQFEGAFMGRVQALARAYELLSAEGWKSVSMADLLRAQLSPFADGKRFNADGCEVMLTADAALGFGLAIYELATNATKYGALSTPNGHIEVSWKVDSESHEHPSDGTGDTARSHNLIMQWRERLTPHSHGGSTLLTC